ncbi:MAG: hypothetical protein ABSE49_09380 [Polyangiaceae bacterium]|jgi:hypothetical protein
MRRVPGLLVTGALLLLAPTASAADATPEQLQFAAQEHDLGYRAYVAKSFDEAATHFENAFFAAPNPAELRSAIRARREAGQLARAATLGAVANRRYPNDAALEKLELETFAQARPKTDEVHVSCAPECNVAVDNKVVTIEKAKEFFFFVDPGKHELVFDWGEGRSKSLALDAKAGASQALHPDAPPVPVKPPPPELPPPVPVAPSRPLGPAVFLVGAGLTVVGVGVTVWSGLDAQKNPGTAAVRADCVGQGTSCPEYQQGLSAQLRTNILLAATGGVAVLTAVTGLFLTQWSHAASPAETPRSGFQVEPAFGLAHGLGTVALKGAF